MSGQGKRGGAAAKGKDRAAAARGEGRGAEERRERGTRGESDRRNGAAGGGAEETGAAGGGERRGGQQRNILTFFQGKGKGDKEEREGREERESGSTRGERNEGNRRGRERDGGERVEREERERREARGDRNERDARDEKEGSDTERNVDAEEQGEERERGEEIERPDEVANKNEGREMKEGRDTREERRESPEREERAIGGTRRERDERDERDRREERDASHRREEERDRIDEARSRARARQFIQQAMGEEEEDEGETENDRVRKEMQSKVKEIIEGSILGRRVMVTATLPSQNLELWRAWNKLLMEGMPEAEQRAQAAQDDWQKVIDKRGGVSEIEQKKKMMMKSVETADVIRERWILHALLPLVGRERQCGVRLRDMLGRVEAAIRGKDGKDKDKAWKDILRVLVAEVLERHNARMRSRPGIAVRDAKVENERWRRKITRLFQAGHVGKAAQILRNKGTVRESYGDKERREMRNLFPRETPTLDIPITKQHKGYVQVSVEEVMALPRSKIDNGRAAGADWMPGNLLFALIQDEMTARALVALTNSCLRGLTGTTSILRVVFNAARMVLLDKTGGGMRPIAIGGAFPKLVSTMALKAVEMEASVACGKLQRGVATTLGVERTALVLQAEIDKRMKRGEKWAGVALDMRNAFGTRKRADIVAAVSGAGGKIAALTPYLSLLYGEATPLIVMGSDRVEAIEFAESGIKQGEPMSPLFFALSVKHEFEAAAVAAGQETVSAAFLDDFSSTGDPDGCARAYIALRDNPPRGMELRPDKCIFLVSSEEDVDEVLLQELKSDGVKIMSGGATKVVGTVIGNKRNKQYEEQKQAMNEEALEEAERLRATMARYKLPAQMRILIWRMCWSTKYVFMMRTRQPREYGEFYRSMDDIMRRGVAEALAIQQVEMDGDLLLTKRLLWPAGLGGTGVKSLEEGATAAFLGGRLGAMMWEGAEFTKAVRETECESWTETEEEWDMMWTYMIVAGGLKLERHAKNMLGLQVADGQKPKLERFFARVEQPVRLQMMVKNMKEEEELDKDVRLTRTAFWALRLEHIHDAAKVRSIDQEEFSMMQAARKGKDAGAQEEEEFGWADKGDRGGAESREKSLKKFRGQSIFSRFFTMALQTQLLASFMGGCNAAPFMGTLRKTTPEEMAEGAKPVISLITYLAACETSSYRLFSVIPTDDDTRLTDAEYQSAARVRFHLPAWTGLNHCVAEHKGWMEAFGKTENNLFAIDSMHGSLCPSIKKQLGSTQRHNIIAECIITCAKDNPKLYYSREPRLDAFLRGRGGEEGRILSGPAPRAMEARGSRERGREGQEEDEERIEKGEERAEGHEEERSERSERDSREERGERAGRAEADARDGEEDEGEENSEEEDSEKEEEEEHESGEKALVSQWEKGGRIGDILIGGGSEGLKVIDVRWVSITGKREIERMAARVRMKISAKPGKLRLSMREGLERAEREKLHSYRKGIASQLEGWDDPRREDYIRASKEDEDPLKFFGLSLCPAVISPLGNMGGGFSELLKEIAKTNKREGQKRRGERVEERLGEVLSRHRDRIVVAAAKAAYFSTMMVATRHQGSEPTRLSERGGER